MVLELASLAFPQTLRSGFLVHLDGTEPLYVYICRHVLADNGHIRFLEI